MTSVLVMYEPVGNGNAIILLKFPDGSYSRMTVKREEKRVEERPIEQPSRTAGAYV